MMRIYIKTIKILIRYMIIQLQLNVITVVVNGNATIKHQS